MGGTMGGSPIDMGLYFTKKTLLLKWGHYYPEVVLFLYCLAVVTKTKPAPDRSWFHHLIMIFLTGFAGGIITPVFLGKPPVLFANDLVIPCTCLAWYFVHHTRFGKVVTKKPVKYSLMAFYEINRANGILKMVSYANSSISPSYFHAPVFGPILIGTLYGTLGAFLPFDKGLASIQNGVPLNIEVAFLGSAIYQFAVYDPTLFGAFMRGLPFFNFTEADHVKMFVVGYFIAMTLVSLHYGPSFDPLARLHAALYTISGLPDPMAAEEKAPEPKAVEAKAVEGKASESTGKVKKQASTGKDAPPTEARSSLSSLKDIFTLSKLPLLVVPVLAIAVKLAMDPPTVLKAGSRLEVGKYLTSCGRLQLALKGCTQHFLAVESEGSLSVYRGSGPQDGNKTRIWTSGIKRSRSQLSTTGYYGHLSTTGNLELKHMDDPDNVLWTSQVGRNRGAPPVGQFSVRLAENGTLGVYNYTAPLWVSQKGK